MPRHATFAELAASMRRLRAQAERGMRRKVGAVLTTAATEAARLTPVDQADARRQWQIRVGGEAERRITGGPSYPSASAAENLAAGKFEERRAVAFVEGRARIDAAALPDRLDGTYQVANPEPYVEALDQGRSPQLPAGGILTTARRRAERVAATTGVLGGD